MFERLSWSSWNFRELCRGEIELGIGSCGCWGCSARRRPSRPTRDPAAIGGGEKVRKRNAAACVIYLSPAPRLGTAQRHGRLERRYSFFLLLSLEIYTYPVRGRFIGALLLQSACPACHCHSQATATFPHNRPYPIIYIERRKTQ